MKKKQNKGFEKHEQGVEELVQRLMASGKFDSVKENIHYNVGGVNGQVDAMATIRVENEQPHYTLNYFYEVKSSYTRKSLNRAIEQYRRFKSVHPKMRMEGYIVTPSKIERLDNLL